MSGIEHDPSAAAWPWRVTVRRWDGARTGWRWLADNLDHQLWQYQAGRNRFCFTTCEDATMFYFICSGDDNNNTSSGDDDA